MGLQHPSPSSLPFHSSPPHQRNYIPELLPRFVSLLADAERTGVYDMVRGGWAGGMYCISISA